jgi:hypothetical protein
MQNGLDLIENPLLGNLLYIKKIVTEENFAGEGICWNGF